ncbi:hypothetical protein KCP75_26185 [Salmonella enterica subsp. enterica]|nr:hypothetical protein KCP75_26185 [Salmonella enterica subsp. enterica]
MYDDNDCMTMHRSRAANGITTLAWFEGPDDAARRRVSGHHTTAASSTPARQSGRTFAA